MIQRVAIRSMPAGVLDRVRVAAAAMPPSFVWGVAQTFGTRVLGIVVGVLTLTLTTWLLGPEGRGQFTLTMAAVAAIIQFGNAGLHASATYWLAQDQTRRHAVSSLLAWFSFGPIAVLFALALVAVRLWPQLIPDVPIRYLALAFLAGPPSMFMLLAGNALLGLGRPGAFNLLDLAGKLAGACAVVFLLWTSLDVVFGVYAALHLVIAVAAYNLLAGSVPPGRPDWRTARDMIGFGARLFVANLAMFLVLRLDLFLLNALAGTKQAGLYSVAVQIGDILMLTSASVAAMLFPRLTAMEAGQRWRATKRVLKVSGAVLAAIAIVLAGMARPVFARWFGPEFVDSTIALYWLLPGLWCLGMNTLLYQHLSAFGLPAFMVVSTCAGAAFNGAVNLWAIPRYGMAGAAAVSSATYILLLVSTIVYLNTSRRTEFTT